MKAVYVPFLSILFLLCMIASPAMAQISNSMWGQGGIRIGTSTTTCNGSAEGGIRYNSVDKWFEFCDGTNWKLMIGLQTGAIDQTPSAFSFTDVTDQPLSTVISSNILNITGISGAVPVSVTGSGSPQIRINGGSWVSSGTIYAGESLQVRLTSSGSASTALTADVTVGDTTDNWSVTTRAAQLRIFRTTNTYNGNLGGLSGADTICQTEATTAGYSGIWKAILSSSTVDAKDRLTLAYPIVRAASTSTTVSATNLWSVPLSNSVASSGVNVRTGTTSAGVKDTWGSWCSDWTDTASTSRQAYGQDNLTSAAWIAINSSGNTCNNTYYLYCIEQ